MALDMDFSKLQPHDVLDLAIFAEEEAQEQYEHFASVMEGHRIRDVAEFFQKMARRELSHRQQLAERRDSLYAGVQPNLANRALWGIEAPRDAKPEASIKPADALALAMEAEKNAEAYYAGALQHGVHPQVARLFESLRQSEIEHQRMLQAEMARHA